MAQENYMAKIMSCQVLLLTQQQGVPLLVFIEMVMNLPAGTQVPMDKALLIAEFTLQMQMQLCMLNGMQEITKLLMTT